MANNYSALGFWRAWHRSYNLWIVRYLYIPLGGTQRLAATSILVFTFVALWHDLSPRLLAWGWLAALFILPEIAARKALPFSLVRTYRPPSRRFGVDEAHPDSLCLFIYLFIAYSLGASGGTVTRVRPAAWATSY